MRATLAVLLLIVLALAGCTANDKDGDDGTATPTASGTTTGSASSTRTGASGTASASGTGTGAPTPNRAPTAQLAASTAAGSLQVNFTIDGTDLDGDGLTWSLAFGDGAAANGTSVPANATHAFAAAGNYTATLVVSDGDLNGTATVNVTVATGAAAGAATQDFSGSWAIGSVDIPFAVTLAGDCAGVEPMDGVFLALFEVDPATYGQPFTATVEAVSTSDSIVAWEVKFLDEDTGCQPAGTYQDGSGPIVGTVPDGVELAWMSSDGGADVTGTYHAG